MTGSVSSYFAMQIAQAWTGALPPSSLPDTLYIGLGIYPTNDQGRYTPQPPNSIAAIARSSLSVIVESGEVYIVIPPVSFGPFPAIIDGQGVSLGTPWIASAWYLGTNSGGSPVGQSLAYGPLNNQPLRAVFIADFNPASAPPLPISGLLADFGGVISTGDILQFGSPCKKNSELVTVQELTVSGTPMQQVVFLNYAHPAGEQLSRMTTTQRYYPGSLQSVSARIKVGAIPSLEALIDRVTLQEL